MDDICAIKGYNIHYLLELYPKVTLYVMSKKDYKTRNVHTYNDT